MDLNFERGDSQRPRGHAVVYFRDAALPERVAATYVVILPVSVDFAKYVPPFLANQVPNMGEGELTAFAFPPAPEMVGTYDDAVSIARLRADDLIFGGSFELSNVTELLNVVGQIVEEYSHRYDANAGALGTRAAEGLEAAEGGGSEGEGPGVDEVLYGFMGEADLLGELTKLVGRLRFAQEGGDTATVEEAAAKVKAISRRMPENRRVSKILEAARTPSEDGAKLTQLYLERAYGLLREDYLRVKSLDEQIEVIESKSA